MINTSDPNILMMDIKHWTKAQVYGVASKLAQSLYDHTPVDTGYARSNWVAAHEIVNDTVGSKEQVDNGRFLSSLAMLNATASVDVMSGLIIYVSNPVPYMGRLNDGWSAQAPAGFIEAAVADAQLHAEWPVEG